MIYSVGAAFIVLLMVKDNDHLMFTAARPKPIR